MQIVRGFSMLYKKRILEIKSLIHITYRHIKRQHQYFEKNFLHFQSDTTYKNPRTDKYLENSELHLLNTVHATFNATQMWKPIEVNLVSTELFVN